jgi:hypothetical protein
VTAGSAPRQAGLVGSAAVCEGRVDENSIWALLHRECHRLFPDELFADLFAVRGRRSVPPSIVAVVMVLQRLFGLSDREAVEAFSFDARWKYAAGGLDMGYPGFAHTVLVDMRARLAGSVRPDRIFEVTVAVAGDAGLVGMRRVLDSTPLYDAVATMDTVTLIRSAVRGLLGVADRELEVELRAALSSGDGYASNAKPQICWEDPAERAALIDSRAKDAYGCLGVLSGRTLDAQVAQAAELLATVVGQDLDQDADGTFRIVRGVASDRVISTVDPDARHGHKTVHRSFDGYKAHTAVDPDSEIITAVTATAGNVGDASVAAALIADVLTDPVGMVVYGDAAYGTGEFLAAVETAGMFTKAEFVIDLDARTVTCPNEVTVAFNTNRHGDGIAYFAPACSTCPLQAQCTNSRAGRKIKISRHETHLALARARRKDPAWIADYRETRPKVERKLGHLMRRRHGGRRARVRGRVKVDADFRLLAAAVNLGRLAILGVGTIEGKWAAR